MFVGPYKHETIKSVVTTQEKMASRRHTQLGNSINFQTGTSNKSQHSADYLEFSLDKIPMYAVYTSSMSRRNCWNLIESASFLALLSEISCRRAYLGGGIDKGKQASHSQVLFLSNGIISHSKNYLAPVHCVCVHMHKYNNDYNKERVVCISPAPSSLIYICYTSHVSSY